MNDPDGTTSPGHEHSPLTVGRPELLRNGTDDLFRSTIHDLLAFGARLRDIRDALAELIGLSGSAYTVMISVAHLSDDAEVHVMTVARHLNVSQPFVTSEVSKLVAAGLLDKQPSVHDRRSVVLTVTERGRRLLAELAPDQRDINDDLFASVDTDDFERLAALMSAMVGDADRALALAAGRIEARHHAGGAA